MATPDIAVNRQSDTRNRVVCALTPSPGASTANIDAHGSKVRAGTHCGYRQMQFSGFISLPSRALFSKHFNLVHRPESPPWPTGLALGGQIVSSGVHFLREQIYFAPA